MGGDDFRDYLRRLVEALEGIRDELDQLEIPEPAPVPEPVPPDPGPLIATIVLAVLGTLVAVVALVIAWRALGILSRMRDEARGAGRRRERAVFGASVRRYSELLGVEAVTGRIAPRGDTSASVRSGLDHRLGFDRESGALELLEEVRVSRDGLDDLPREARASANGLAAMDVEWSIERWVDDPETWLRDHRERHRLRTAAQRAGVTADAGADAVDGDTRVT